MLCHQKNTKTQSLFFRLINAVRKPELTRHLDPPRSRELGRVQVSCSLRHHLQDWCDLSEAMWPLSHASCLHDLNLTSPVIIVEQIQYWVFISHNHKKKLAQNMINWLFQSKMSIFSKFYWSKHRIFISWSHDTLEQNVLVFENPYSLIVKVSDLSSVLECAWKYK